MSDAVIRPEKLELIGTQMISDVAEVLKEAVIERSIDSASTLTLDVHDDERTLLRSGIFSDRTTVQIDEYAFDLAKVRKAGRGLNLVFEDLPVAALRRRSDPIKVNPNTVTHIEFAERLAREAGVQFWTPPELRAAVKSKVELARGKPDDATAGEDPEDSWTAMGRIADERGWRRFIKGSDTVAYVPETWLIAQPATYVLKEGGEGVDNIDFDFDRGKPIATMQTQVRSGRWSVPVGSTVDVAGLGPADGRWLVSSTRRSLFSLFIDVTLTKARPVLPEPEPPASTAATASAAPSSSSSTSSASSSGGYYPADPKNLVKIGQGSHRLVPDAAASFKRVEAKFGRQVTITDSYRSTASQVANYKRDPSRFGKPGKSAHNEGRAVDVHLKAVGVGNQSANPRLWDKDPVWRRLNAAFQAEGWCNYQYKNGTTKGRTSEPWHWSYKVCK